MNDQFLKAYHRLPPRNFAAALSHKLGMAAQAAPRTAPRRSLRLAAMAAAVMAAFALALIVSPSARAQVLDVIREIGGLVFEESAGYPGGSDGEPTIVSPKIYSLAEAQAALPFAIPLPEWVPDGYVLADEVRVTEFPEAKLVYAELTYRKPGSQMGWLSLDVRQQTPGEKVIDAVGASSTEAVAVNGQPAALVRGGWDADQQAWVDNGMLNLYWTRGATTWILQTRTQELAPEDLIQIAESVPE